MKREAKRRFLIFLAILVGIILLLKLGKDFMPDIDLLMQGKQSRAELMQSMRSHGWEDWLVLTFLVGILCAIPGVSNSVVCVFTGLCYGPFGIIINWVGNVLGNITVYILIKNVGLSHKMRKSKIIDDLKHVRYPTLRLILGYSIPMVPSFMVNYTANALRIPKSHTLVAIMIGMLPTSILYATGGNALFKGNHGHAAILIFGVILLAILYVAIRKLRLKKVHVQEAYSE